MKKAKFKKDVIEEFDVDAIRQYMKLSVREKFIHLESLNLFFETLIPPQNKRIQEQLRREGW